MPIRFPELSQDEFVVLLLTQEFGVRHYDGPVGVRVKSIRAKFAINGNGNGDHAESSALAAPCGAPTHRPTPPGYDTITIRQATPDELMSETTKTSRVLEYLRDHGPSTGPEISEGLGLNRDSVKSMLYKMRAQGRVRRTNSTRRAAGTMGPSRTVFEIVPDDQIMIEQTKVTKAAEAAEAAQTPPPRLDGMTAADLEALLDAYCQGIDLMEASVDTLELVLRVRRAIDAGVT